MYVVKVTNRFKKDVEHCRRRNLDLSKLETIVDLLKEAFRRRFETIPVIGKK